MPGKVFVYIQAYNSEKTIRRAIDSIINQTYQDFECLVCNNGSTDKTEEIIKAYQKEDSRIHLVSVEQNSRNVFYDVAMPIFFEKYVEECEFFCNLDSDDEYLPDFFQNSITFMNDNNLDIAMGGIYFRDARTLETIGQRFTDEQVIIEGDNFSKLFPIYHQYMRTIWGKLYRCSVIKQMDYLKCRIVSYGADSLFAQEAVIKSNRVGILNQFIHIYYL